MSQCRPWSDSRVAEPVDVLCGEGGVVHEEDVNIGNYVR